MNELSRVTLLATILLGCASRTITAPSDGSVQAADDASRTDVAADTPGAGGLPLPVDPTGLCPMPDLSKAPAGTFLFAPQDMDAVVPVPSNEPTMYIIDPGGLLPASVIGLAAARLTLQAWPAGPPLAITTRIERPDVDPRTRIVVQPTAPLPNGWFVLRLADPPAGLTRLGPWDVHPYGERGLETRFHTASFPMLSWVRVCNSGGGTMVFRLEHSQNLTWSRPLDSILSLSQAGASPSCVVRDLAGSGSKERLQFECTSVSDTAPVTIETKAGFASRDGVAVAPARYIFELPSLPRIKDLMVFQTNPPL